MIGLGEDDDGDVRSEVPGDRDDDVKEVQQQVHEGRGAREQGTGEW